MFKTIYFRADGNSSIGLGHVIRSLALADMLIGHFQCTFLVQDPSPELANQIQKNSHTLISLPGTNEYLIEAEKITPQYFSSDSIVVLDGYEFRTDYQQIVKSSGCKLVCIDDLHAWHFVADAIINHAGGTQKEQYSCETTTQLYLGTNYALLRKSFLEVPQRPNNSIGKGQLFVCFGGSDPANLTYRTIRVAATIDWITKIIAVVGSAALHGEKLIALKNTVPTLELYTRVEADEMVSLMRQCELAITPASGISYEIASVGLYFITGYYADNQKYLYQFLVENELALGADQFQEESLRRLLNSRAWMHSPVLKQQEKLFAGKSSRHLLAIFIKLSLDSRRASTEDVTTYFDWANEPETRKNSLNPTLIAWPQHQAWFSDRINNPKFVFYLFCLNGIPVGQVRFEVEQTEAMLSYSVDADYRGMGVGREIISQAIEQLTRASGVDKVTGVVKNDNRASLITFEKIGFKVRERTAMITTFELNVECVL